jgi:hypothetical protein
MQFKWIFTQQILQIQNNMQVEADLTSGNNNDVVGSFRS